MNENEINHFTSDEKILWWGYGPWVDEPDEVTFTHNGIDCRIVRINILDGPNRDHHFGGYLCGYIKVPMGHPFYSVEEYFYIDLDVHGGVTYNRIHPDNFLWVGFDCAHSSDVCPSIEKLQNTLPELMNIQRKTEEMKKKFNMQDSPIFQKSYKDITFVIGECKSMAEQIMQVSHDN